MIRLAALALSALFFTPLMPAQPFSATQTTRDGFTVVRLEDSSAGAHVSVAPSVGNIAYEYVIHGKNAFWWPFESLEEFAKGPKLSGNPLLWPWANRLDRDGFFANGRYYALQPELGNVRRDGNKLPIHGLLTFSDLWKVVELGADDQSAWVVSRIEYARHPELAAQFPFAHSIEMVYRLRGGELEVETRIANESAEAMPLSLGYHPYFQLHDAPRDEWRVHLAARSRWELNDKLTPTGEKSPVSERFANADDLSLAGVTLDDVFGDLIREAGDWARFSVMGKREKLEVLYGPGFETAVVYAPGGQGRSFICFEPMTGVTNAFNLAHEGKYGELQSIPAGASWSGRYIVRLTGF
ncbi:MAG: aldose 1-epimerase [Acidobacteria bacterium]|nr:aldose 1-epimerase [Acidobacteriota bacterium]